MNKYILDEYRRWKIQKEMDEDLLLELKQIEGLETEIFDRFYKELEFGTGGLRGVIGAGSNRINIYTVGKATQGYSNFLNRTAENPSVAIAYDSRINSQKFSQYAAAVFAANNIKVFLYKELTPTPALSFAIRDLCCSGGIVITASHNPAKYNGYKVYGADGGQITTASAKEIQEEINKVHVFSDVIKLTFDEALASGLVSYIDDSVLDAFIDAVSSQQLCGGDMCLDKNVSIVYTPLNGAGLKCVTRALHQNGYANITIVKEQEYPDGNFSTCPYPNPEIQEAMNLGIEYARRVGSDLLIATDPDCDRVGAAVKTQEGYRLISGNEMGLLLFDYICKRRNELHNMPAQPVLVKTIVTTDLVKKMAAFYQVEVVDVLTGFKFIGEQIGLLEKKGAGDSYIFGFEESYGYLSGGYVRDKDGVGASLLICEMFAFYKKQGLNLIDVLSRIYKQFGYCKNSLKSYTFEGAQGFEHMQHIMKVFRETPINTFAKKIITAKYDYLSSRKTTGDNSPEALQLPSADVLKFELEGGSSIVIRPSGTEPKLKLYLSISSENEACAEIEESQIVAEIEQKIGI